MKARGNVRKLLIVLGEIQDKIGRAMNIARNDRDPDQLEHLYTVLGQVFEMCIDARGLYDPIDAPAPTSPAPGAEKGGDTSDKGTLL